MTRLGFSGRQEDRKTGTDLSASGPRTTSSVPGFLSSSFPELLGAAAVLVASACAHVPDRGHLELACPVPEAEVYVDDYYVGRCVAWAAQAVPLKPGHHTVEVRAEGRYPFYGELEVLPGGSRRLEIALRERLD